MKQKVRKEVNFSKFYINNCIRVICILVIEKLNVFCLNELKKCDIFIVVLFKVMFVIRVILDMENILVNFEQLDLLMIGFDEFDMNIKF